MALGVKGRGRFPLKKKGESQTKKGSKLAKAWGAKSSRGGTWCKRDTIGIGCRNQDKKKG